MHSVGRAFDRLIGADAVHAFHEDISQHDCIHAAHDKAGRQLKAGVPLQSA